ncbi:MAG: smc, chromosome segregation ATPase, chromosome segregation protein [Candidatus Magasanikbacteria bacterium]|nr:smc, chromosome segregation ATPase, chromosome segregation protein [Candidatus Magasanikbacteria bacterium]
MQPSRFTSASMYLQRLEAQGFKSFANRTVLEFRPPKNGKRGVTGVVGPNGSGKSNIADAIRWVLGEQSLKLLRGKKSEDVIFSGSDRKSRLGFAEVSLVLNNENGGRERRIKEIEEKGEELTPLEFSEIVITRRLYRDGESEYLINGHNVRLTDIQLLLARARFGQKTYAVIGQGMIDHILVASPSERKEFFDEAAGVKEYQIKRHQALNKLGHTRENMAQASGLLAEIEPRVKSLLRQVKKLEERGQIEAELMAAEKRYYGKLWIDLAEKLEIFKKDHQELSTKMKKRQHEYQTLLDELKALEQKESETGALTGLQKEYEKLISERQKIHEEAVTVNTKIEIAKVRRQSEKVWAPLPLSDILFELDALHKKISHVLSVLRGVKTLAAVTIIIADAEKIEAQSGKLLERMQKPQEKENAAPDPALTEKLEDLKASELLLEEKIVGVRKEMEQVSKEDKQEKTQFFELQRRLQSKQSEIHGEEQRLNAVAIELARLETRRETLEEEMQNAFVGRGEEAAPKIAEIKTAEKETLAGVQTDALQPLVFKLRHQLEMIGGIDELVVKEYEETNSRYQFLSGQMEDLTKALADTERAIKELDELLKDRREQALNSLNSEFDRFFKMLFSGGAARLAPVFAEEADLEKEAEEGEALVNAEVQDEIASKKSREPILVGMEIQATPPGKRIKDINILSGGERAMTSVALICAIMANNPSPFVVLDEVDAALDESNSIRFAEIIDQLADKTQFIVITHNRATMYKSDILYGVTMGEDGVSKILSVNIEEAEKMRAKK